MAYKFQITLPADLAAELKREATKQRVPLAELIRRTMREKLRQSRSTTQQGENPLAAISGIVDCEETNLASRVDDILYR